MNVVTGAGWAISHAVDLLGASGLTLGFRIRQGWCLGGTAWFNPRDQAVWHNMGPFIESVKCKANKSQMHSPINFSIRAHPS